MPQEQLFGLKKLQFRFTCSCCRKQELSSYSTIPPYDWGKVHLEVVRQGPHDHAEVLFCPDCTIKVQSAITDALKPFVTEDPVTIEV
jgi:hypothetical protein